MIIMDITDKHVFYNTILVLIMIMLYFILLELYDMGVKPYIFLIPSMILLFIALIVSLIYSRDIESD